MSNTPEAEVEQLRVQLAGCSVAAKGFHRVCENGAKPGDWGWSPTYQDVVDLYERFDALREFVKASPLADLVYHPKVNELPDGFLPDVDAARARLREAGLL